MLEVWDHRQMNIQTWWMLNAIASSVWSSRPQNELCLKHSIRTMYSHLLHGGHISCPLITVAGLVYMGIKHLIDRYNIYYVYNPSKINSNIHSTAIMFVHIAFLMMQAQIFTVTLVRTGYSRVFGLALFVFLVSLLVFSGHFFFYMFRNINHLTYRATRKQAKARREYCACAYLPPVLYNLNRYPLNKWPSTASIERTDVDGSNVAWLSSIYFSGHHWGAVMQKGEKREEKRREEKKRRGGGEKRKNEIKVEADEIK